MTRAAYVAVAQAGRGVSLVWLHILTMTRATYMAVARAGRGTSLVWLHI